MKTAAFLFCSPHEFPLSVWANFVLEFQIFAYKFTHLSTSHMPPLTDILSTIDFQYLAKVSKDATTKEKRKRIWNKILVAMNNALRSKKDPPDYRVYTLKKLKDLRIRLERNLRNQNDDQM